MSDCLPRLLDDDEVARLLGYRNATAFRRRRKQLEAEGFPKRRPIVKRYSPMEVREWIDGDDGLQSGSDPLLEVAGKWGASLSASGPIVGPIGKGR
jgi:predicted DNA-binding transcriptional regulator AlpA